MLALTVAAPILIVLIYRLRSFRRLGPDYFGVICRQRHTGQVELAFEGFLAQRAVERFKLGEALLIAGFDAFDLFDNGGELVLRRPANMVIDGLLSKIIAYIFRSNYPWAKLCGYSPSHH